MQAVPDLIEMRQSRDFILIFKSDNSPESEIRKKIVRNSLKCDNDALCLARTATLMSVMYLQWIISLPLQTYVYEIRNVCLISAYSY